MQINEIAAIADNKTATNVAVYVGFVREVTLIKGNPSGTEG
ncbi:hypothetical protein [Dickeya fangzhongdai]|nr:hypothetical protein [Dickeya fangzhongdai]WOX99046.1 hypothetical protein OGM22_15510 [Dickeya fangzhongdai]WOY05802.1 hypothetical protein OGM21_06915 [Dickeya fangzhongdai]GGC03442.1 hypothetical protein GCM10007171_20680 [Dickeya fangzhongdai]